MKNIHGMYLIKQTVISGVLWHLWEALSCDILMINSSHWPLGNEDKLLNKYIIFKLTWVIRGWGISCEIALRWMSLNLIGDKSILARVMAWCHRATSWDNVDPHLFVYMVSLGHNELITAMFLNNGGVKDPGAFWMTASDLLEMMFRDGCK